MQIVWLSFIMEGVRGTQLRRYIYQVLRLWQRWFESVSRGAITDFLALFNDAGRVFISDIKSIEGEYRDLFKRMADVRIWSTSAVLLNKAEQCFGAIAVMNPRANSGSMDLIDMIGISISNSLFYEKARAKY